MDFLELGLLMFIKLETLASDLLSADSVWNKDD
jgi:hypothetical protein